MSNILKSLVALVIMTSFLSCNQQDKVADSNPLLESWDTPFGIPPFERIKADHYLEAFEVAFEEQLAEVERIVSDTTEVSFHSVIVALDSSGERLLDLKDLFEMTEAAISDSDWVRVGEIVKPRISEVRDSVLMNGALFEKVKTVYDMRKKLKLNAVDGRLLEKTYSRFVRGGALLDAEQKVRLAEINSRIAAMSSRFSANLIAENDRYFLDLGVKDLEGLNNDLKSVAKEEAERRGLSNRWVFSLSPTMMTPFLAQSVRRDLREQLYKAYLMRGSNGGENDNREIVKEVTQLRQERARLLGYKNHAEYVISEQMALTPKAAYELLDRVWTPALECAKLERDELQLLLEVDNKDAKLEPWDWWFYTERRRNKEFKLNEESVRQYFSLGGVRSGIFTLANRLYGITFRPAAVPLYEPSCSTFEVLDRDGTHLGVLYLDLYARPSKGQGAWCGNLREQRHDGGDRVTPVVAVVCNFPKPMGNTPSLLTMNQVETLFHEFGHALHFLFQDVDYRSLSSALVEGDFVEFPSQVMENWAFEPEMLRKYALHHRTSRPMTDEMMGKISKMKMLNQGYETVSYTAAAILDLDLQMLEDLDGFDLERFEQESLRERRGLIAEIEPRYHLPYFSHLFTYDYSAGYYFYLWSEVLDQDCFELFKSRGDIFSSELAERLRREVLKRGGEARGGELYRNFKGEDPSEMAMLRSKGLLPKEEPVVDSLAMMKSDSLSMMKSDSLSVVKPDSVAKLDSTAVEKPKEKIHTKKRINKKK